MRCVKTHEAERRPGVSLLLQFADVLLLGRGARLQEDGRDPAGAAEAGGYSLVCAGCVGGTSVCSIIINSFGGL